MRVILWRLTDNFLPLSLLAVLAAPAVVAEDPTVNRLLASQCAQCHGTDGYALGEFDELAGEEAKDLFEDLIDMKREDRPENIMDHQAAGYSDDQIRRIANYYSSLPEESADHVRGESGSALDSETTSGEVYRREHEDEDDESEDDHREHDEDD